MLTGRAIRRRRRTLDVLSNVLKAEPEWTALPTVDATGRSIAAAALSAEGSEPRVCATSRMHDSRSKTRSTSLRVVQSPRRRRLRQHARAPVVGGRARRRRRRRRRWQCACMPRTSRFSSTRFASRSTTPPTTEPTSLAISPDGKTLAFVGDVRRQVALMAAAARRRSGAAPGRDRERQVSILVARRPIDRILRGCAAQAHRRRQRIGAGVGVWGSDGRRVEPGRHDPLRSGAGVLPCSASRPTAASRPPRHCSTRWRNVTPGFRSSCPTTVTFSSTRLVPRPGIYLGQLGSVGRATTDPRAQAAMYASSGHLLFVRQGTLFAQPFDPVRLELAGNATAVAEQIVAQRRTHQGRRRLSASAAGPHRLSDGAGRRAVPVRVVRPGRQVLETVAGADIGSGFNSVALTRRPSPGA